MRAISIGNHQLDDINIYRHVEPDRMRDTMPLAYRIGEMDDGLSFCNFCTQYLLLMVTAIIKGLPTPSRASFRVAVKAASSRRSSVLRRTLFEQRIEERRTAAYT